MYSLLLDDHTPWVILTTVHDVLQTLLQGRGDHAALAAFAHVDRNVLASVVDQRHRCDKVLENHNQ